MVRRLVVPGVLLAATALAATACGPVTQPVQGGGTSSASATSGTATPSPSASSSTSRSGSPSTSSTSSPSSSSSSTPTPTKTRDPLDIGDKTLRSGQKNDRVKALQRLLKSMHYDPGKVDGSFGLNTEMAVWAFQEVNGIEAHGTVGSKTRAALADPKDPKVLVRKGPRDRVEVSLKRQILVVYENDEVELISHVSTGTGQHYCDKWKDDDTGETGTSCGVAVTPTGDYRAYRRIGGWRHAKLGLLYNPVYFNGGIAVHGAPSVPQYPASHGCVRIPMHTAEVFPGMVQPNERVYVRR